MAFFSSTLRKQTLLGFFSIGKVFFWILKTYILQERSSETYQGEGGGIKTHPTWNKAIWNFEPSWPTETSGEITIFALRFFTTLN